MGVEMNMVDEAFEAIEKALRKCGIPGNWYSLGTEKEESVCFIFEDDVWKVIGFEKGHRDFERRHAILEDAVGELFGLLARSEFKRKRLMRLYRKYCGTKN